MVGEGILLEEGRIGHKHFEEGISLPRGGVTSYGICSEPKLMLSLSFHKELKYVCSIFTLSAAVLLELRYPLQRFCPIFLSIYFVVGTCAIMCCSAVLLHPS